MRFVLTLRPGAIEVRTGGQMAVVRGKPRYEIDYDATDPLHQFLDSLDQVTVSELFAGDPVAIDPTTPASVLACRNLFDLPSPWEMLMRGLLD